MVILPDSCISIGITSFQVQDNKSNGGEGGIRTLDRVVRPYNGLANRRLQPLGHLSGVWNYSLPLAAIRLVRAFVLAAPRGCAISFSLNPDCGRCVILKRPDSRLVQSLSHAQRSFRAFFVIVEPETNPRRPDCFLTYWHSHYAAWADASHPDCALDDE